MFAKIIDLHEVQRCRRRGRLSRPEVASEIEEMSMDITATAIDLTDITDRDEVTIYDAITVDLHEIRLLAADRPDIEQRAEYLILRMQMLRRLDRQENARHAFIRATSPLITERVPAIAALSF